MYRAILVAALISITWLLPRAQGQTPDGWDWSARYATGQTEFATDVAVDSLHNAVYTSGSVEKGFSGLLGGLWALLFGSNTQSDGYLVKRDLNGAVQWQIVVGGSGEDACTGVCVDATGNVYVTGYFSGSSASFTGTSGSNQTMTSSGGRDIFVVCYNASGVVQWKLKAGASGDDQGNGIRQANGKLFIGGSFNGSPTISGMTSSAAATAVNNRAHAFIAALQTSDGSGIWRVDGANSENSAINAVASDGLTVYALGVHKGTSYNYQNNSGSLNSNLTTVGGNLSTDVLAVSIGGSFKWVKAVSNPGNDAINALGLAASSTAVYIAGSTNNDSRFPGGSVVNGGTYANDFAYLARLAPGNGLTVWTRTFQSPSGSGNNQVGRSIALDSHGDVLFTGSYKQNLALPNGSVISGANNVQVFVAKFSGSGTLKWAVTPTGDKDDLPNGLAVDGTGGVYVAGSYKKDITFNSAYSDDSSDNLFIAKLHDLDFDVAGFRDPSEFNAPVALCESNAPIDLTGWLVAEKMGTGKTIFSSSGVTGPEAALGLMPGGAAMLDNVNDQIVIDLGDTIPTGKSVILRWRSLGGTAILNVQGSLVGASAFTDFGNKTTSSTTMVLVPVTATAPMRYIKLNGGGTNACEVDGVFYNFGSVTGGIWSGTGMSGSTFNPAGLSGNVDITYTVNGRSTTKTVAISPNSVAGTLSSSSTICPGTNVAISLNGQVGTAIDWQISVNGGSTWTSAPTGLSSYALNNVTQTTLAKAKVTNGVCPSVFSNTVSIVPQDSIAPVIQNCPANITANTEAGLCGAHVSYTMPTATDNCTPTVSVANSVAAEASGSLFPLGITTVQLKAVDASGNAQTCAFSITVVDTVKPTLSCPQAVAVSTNSGCTTTGIVLGTPTTSDNCGPVTVTNNAPSTYPLGVTNVTWTATDASGNFQSCIQQVTVSDNTPPNISCPANQSVPANAGCTATAVILGIPVTTDNCGIASVTNNATSSFSSGITIITWTVIDNSGNSNTCQQSVTVTDITPPTLSCPPAVQVAANTGCVATGVVLGNPVAVDNCTVASLTNNAPTSGFPIGTTIVTWTAMDAAGNTATCAQSITVTDTIPPTISCPANVQANTNSGCTATGINLGSPTVSDNCTGTSVSHNAPSAFPKGSTTVTWTATDASGNTASCTQIVTVTDNIPPVITCAGNIQATTNTGCTATGVNLGIPSVSDNCTNVTVSNNAPSAFPKGTTTVTWTATDASGNIATCSQIVTVTDNIPPVITCPANVQAYTNAGCSATGVNLGTPTASDNCSGVAISNNAPANFPKGATTVTWTATDASGNIATCTQTVTVTDNIPPVITCPPAVQVNTNTACNATGVNLGIPAISDNCSGTTVSNNAPTVFPKGTTTVTWTASDASGNTATCTQTVTVTDNIPPVITCPVNIQVHTNTGCTATGVNLGTPSVSDNCTGITVSNNAPSAFQIGVTTVTWTALDASGNTATCTQSVTVTDVTAPVISGPANVQVAANAGCTATGVSLGTPSYSDNCAVATISNNAPSAFPLGTTTVTWTATDASGNMSTSTQYVTVSDQTDPVAICREATVNVDGTGWAQVTAAMLNDGSNDDCTLASLSISPQAFNTLGDHEVTLTATDGAGNSASCVTVVHVVDNAPPTAICTNVTVYLDPSGEASISALDLDGGSMDNDSIMSYSASTTHFTCADAGTVADTLFVTDNGGNSSFCIAQVTVADTILPIAIGHTVQVYLDSSGEITLPAYAMDNGSSDACGGLIFTASDTAFSCAHLGAVDVMLTVTDANGNSASCNTQVIVHDTIAPIAQCQAVTAYLDATGHAQIAASDVDAGSTDNCAIGDRIVSPSIVQGAGEHTVQLIVTDNSGNSDTCSAVVTVIDVTPPMALCTDTILQLGTSGTVSINALDLDGGSTDNDAINQWAASQLVFGCADTGLNTDTLFVIDGSGNTAYCVSTITIVDPFPANAGGDNTADFCAGGASAALLPYLGAGAQPGGSWWYLGGSATGMFDPALDAPGGYLYTVTNPSGCRTDSATVNVVIHAMAQAGLDTSITVCSNGTLVDLSTLLNGADSDGYWSNGSGLYDPATDDPGTSTYIVDGSGQCPADTAFITVLEQAQPNAGSSTILALCSNGVPVDLFIALGGSPDQGGQWSQSNGTLTNGMFAPGADLPDTFTYTVNALSPCYPTSSTVTVTVTDAPSAAWTCPMPVCSTAEPLDMDITVSGATGGTWSGPGIATDGQHFDPGAVSPQGAMEAFTLNYSVSINGCTNSQNGTVTVLTGPVADAGPDGEECSLDHVLAASQNVGAGTWSAAQGITFSDVHAPDAIVHATATGSYNLSWTLSNEQCSDTDTMHIAFHLPEEITAFDAGPDQDQNILRNATLYGTVEGATEFRWSVIGGSGNIAAPDEVSTEIDNLAVGTNLVMLNASVGVCPLLSDTVMITVHDLFIPTGFSPNGDGVNDTFSITGIEELPGNELTVFDRWGQSVFRVKGYANEWDGRGVSGKELIDGTYFYVLNFTGSDPYHGQIIIKR